MRRSLADPYSLGDEIPAWQPPAAIPRPEDVRTAIATLDATLKPAGPKHIAWAVGTMAHAMAMKKGDTLAMALRTEGWVIACGELPEDLWTEGVREVLQTKTYFPAPAEFLAVVGPKWRERQRMRERARWMLNPAGKIAEPEEKPIATRLGRLEHTRSIYARMNRRLDVDRIDREIAAEKGEELGPNEAVLGPIREERPPFKPDTSPSARRCAELAAARHAPMTPREQPPMPDAIPE